METEIQRANARLLKVGALLFAPLLGCSWALHAQQGGSSVPAQASPEADGTVTLHTGTHLVVLDVSVFDWKGTPVTGLKKGDFHLFEDGREQAIKDFEENAPIDPAMAEEKLAAVASKLPPNTYTNFKPFPNSTINVVVLDALTSPPYMCGLTRPASACEGGNSQSDHYDEIQGYMKKVPAGTPFIIYRLDTQLHLVQGLTTDPAVLREAVKLQGDRPLSQPEANYFQKRQMIGSAVDQLKTYLAAYPGRKTLIWFSTTLGGDLSPTGINNEPTENALFCRWTDSLQQSRIQAYRTGTHPPGAVFSGLGCQASRNVGDTIAAAVDNAAHFYTLSYTPTNGNWDGKYRKFKVTLSGSGLASWKGVGLDYREGYYGRLDDGSVRSNVTPALHTVSAESVALRQAMVVGAPEPDDIVFQASVNPDAKITKDTAGAAAPPGNYLSEPLRTQGYRGYTVQYLIRADQLGLTGTPGEGASAEKLEVVAVLFDSAGHPINSRKSEVSVSFNGPDDPRIQTATVTANLTTQVPVTGNYFMRLGVRDAVTDKVGALEIPVSSIKLASPER
jgi:VWFA-related protein